MLPTQIWIVMKQSTNLKLNEPIVEWNECEMLTTITGSKNSQQGVNSQVDYQNHNALGPPKVSPLQT